LHVNMLHGTICVIKLSNYREDNMTINILNDKTSPYYQEYMDILEANGYTPMTMKDGTTRYVKEGNSVHYFTLSNGMTILAGTGGVVHMRHPDEDMYGRTYRK
jgi:hypothetical protein